MSYVVGINIEGITSIICETRVSYEDGSGDYSALKSGDIFPGCIYGGAGDANGIRIFIQQVKIVLTTDVERPYTVFFQMFLDFISSFKFEDNGHFELIISTRHSGMPELYHFNSNTKILSKCTDFVSIGSGKLLLDDDLVKYISDTKTLLLEQLRDHSLLFLYPYPYCLWLMERVEGVEESSKLRDIGVGGVFHYSYQTANMASRQQPALYVLSRAFGSSIYSYCVHVTFQGPALVITSATQDTRAIILDSAAWMDAERLTADESENFSNDIIEKVDKQPYYIFCGFGFLDPAQRAYTGYHFTTKEDYHVSKDGIMRQEDIDMIKSIYSETTLKV